MEFAQGRARFKGRQRHSHLPEIVLQVAAGGKYLLGGNVFVLVENVIQDLNAEMGNADFVKIGKGQGDAQLHRIRRLMDAVGFAAQVAAWFINVA